VTIFWDVMPCIAVQLYQRFGGMYCFQLQGREARHANNKQQVGGNITRRFIPEGKSIGVQEVLHLENVPYKQVRVLTP
jgi:hypothetical protein